MELSSQVSLKSELRQTLVKKIKAANLMRIPDDVIIEVADFVGKNPDAAERFLQESKKASSHEIEEARLIQSFYSTIGREGKRKSQGGMIIAPCLKGIEAVISAPAKIEFPYDVFYIATKGEEPTIVFSEHLKGDISVKMDLEPQYEQTLKLLSTIKRFEDWKRPMLRNAYVLIGEVQREFFENFDEAKLNELLQRDIADRLGISVSSISRLLQNRKAKARSLNEDELYFSLKDFFGGPQKLKIRVATPLINEVLAEEFEKGIVYKDEEIASRVGLSRRTVSKHLRQAGIPNKWERDRRYFAGELIEPYRM